MRLLLTLILLVLPLFGAVTVDTNGITVFSSATTYTLPLTLSGNLLVAWYYRYDTVTTADPTGMTYNGVALTYLCTALHGSYVNERIFVYYLKAPATGASHDLVASIATAPSNAGALGAVSFNNVDQTTPLGACATVGAYSGTTETVAVASVSGDLVVDVVSILNGNDLVVDGSQTERARRFQLDSISTSSSTKAATTTSTNMTWTTNASHRWYHAGVAVKPGAATRRRQAVVVQ